jgi:hypothetical protein
MSSNNVQFDVDQHLTQDSDSIGSEREDGSSQSSDPTHTSEQTGSRGESPRQASSEITGGAVGVEDHVEEGGGFERPPGGIGRRRMGRIPPKYYRIGELVDYAGVSRQTIHNYATMGLLQEAQWTKGGHRLFSQDAFERLAVIADMKAESQSMHEIREYFRKLDSKPTLDSA